MRSLLCLSASLLAGVSLLPAHDLPASTTSSGKLAFLIPNLYGSSGLVLPNPEHEAHFDSAFQRNFTPLNTAIASQLSSLPLPSAASGFTYSFDRSLGVYERSGQSFGPVLAERAETIGKDKFYFGFSFQNFGFDRIDGVPLNRLPSLFEHGPSTNTQFARDVITTDNFVDLRLGQTVAFLTYGAADWLDVSVAVPYVTASLTLTSNATIQRIGTGDDRTVHYFEGTSDRSRQQFANAGSASGLGDVVVRTKASLYRGETAALALGVDTRLPTGDEYDFLGSGALGVRPFLVASLRAGRVSPHVNVGYQWNGQTILAGNVTTGETRRLPAQLQYAFGADVGVTRRLTVAVDLLGQHLRRAERVEMGTFRASNGATFPQISFAQRSLTQNNLALGFKMNPVGNLLVSVNMLAGLGNAGLRDRFTPLVGLSYTF